MNSSISIIIPVLNESQTLPELIARLSAIPKEEAELIFVDGGSVDNTMLILSSSGYRVICAPKGRANQMNAGAAVSAGDILLFLHADTHLPINGLDRVRESLQKKPNQSQWGRFNVKILGNSWMFLVIAWFMNQRSRLTGIVTGDQAIFVTKALFEKIGGFPIQPLMEDIELSKRLKSWSKPIALKDKVLTSGRRWEQRGLWRTIFLMWTLRFGYWRGVDPVELAKRYQ